MKKQTLICLIAFVVLLVALLGGCATHTPLDVGQVVIAPKVTLPAPPMIVQQTQAKPVGYFQQTLLDFFSDSPVKPTTSTPPTPAAGPTPSQ